MLIYRIDYEVDAVSHREKRVAFRATRPEVDIFKKALGVSVTDFSFAKIDVPTGRYELAAWLNKTFGSKARAMRAEKQ